VVARRKRRCGEITAKVVEIFIDEGMTVETEGEDVARSTVWLQRKRLLSGGKRAREEAAYPRLQRSTAP